MSGAGSDVTLAVVFALVAAFSNAVNLWTQRSASVPPEAEKGWQLAACLVRQPPWLPGAAARAGSFASGRSRCTKARRRDRLPPRR